MKIKGWKKTGKSRWDSIKGRTVFVSKRPDRKGYSAYYGKRGMQVASYIHTDRPLTKTEAIKIAIESMKRNPNG